MSVSGSSKSIRGTSTCGDPGDVYYCIHVLSLYTLFSKTVRVSSQVVVERVWHSLRSQPDSYMLARMQTQSFGSAFYVRVLVCRRTSPSTCAAFHTSSKTPCRIHSFVEISWGSFRTRLPGEQQGPGEAQKVVVTCHRKPPTHRAFASARLGAPIALRLRCCTAPTGTPMQEDPAQLKRSTSAAPEEIARLAKEKSKKLAFKTVCAIITCPLSSMCCMCSSIGGILTLMRNDSTREFAVRLTARAEPATRDRRLPPLLRSEGRSLDIAARCRHWQRVRALRRHHL